MLKGPTVSIERHFTVYLMLQICKKDGNDRFDLNVYFTNQDTSLICQMIRLCPWPSVVKFTFSRCLKYERSVWKIEQNLVRIIDVWISDIRAVRSYYKRPKSKRSVGQVD